MRALRHARFCAFDPAKMGGTYAKRERFNTAAFVAPDRSFLFVKNEKCGNNTARMTLQRLVAKEPLPEGFKDANRWAAPLLQPSDLRLKRIADINDAVSLKFAIVRDPYSRLLSAYLDKIEEGGRKRGKFEQKLGGPVSSFAEFVERVCAQTPEEMDPHWRAQTHNLFCDIVRYDRILKFERFEEEFSALLEELGGAPIASVRKGRHKAAMRLGDYYTSELAAKVAGTFAADFERFGYTRELP